MSNSTRNRVPRGVPTGGEFAQGAHTEPDLGAISPDTGGGSMTEKNFAHCTPASDHPGLAGIPLTDEQRRCRVVEVDRSGVREAYLIPNSYLALRAASVRGGAWGSLPNVDMSEQERRRYDPLRFADGSETEFSAEELAQFDPAPLQSPIAPSKPRLRDLDLERVPANRRAKVDADLDRPLHWLPNHDDGTPGTIRNEIAQGRIVGKKEDSGGKYFVRTSLSEDTSSACEDDSHKSIGVSASLFSALADE